MSDNHEFLSAQEHAQGMFRRMQERVAPGSGANVSEKGFWVCPGSIVLEDAGDFKIRVAARFLYPPHTKWGHVLFEGVAEGSHNLPKKMPVSGTAFIYRSIDDLIGLGDIDVSVNAGSFQVGGAHLGFTKGRDDIGFFIGAALLVEGSAQGVGKGRFKRD